MSNDTVTIRLQKGTYGRDLLWRVTPIIFSTLLSIFKLPNPKLVVLVPKPYSDIDLNFQWLQFRKFAKRRRKSPGIEMLKNVTGSDVVTETKFYKKGTTSLKISIYMDV